MSSSRVRARRWWWPPETPIAECALIQSRREGDGVVDDDDDDDGVAEEERARNKGLPVNGVDVNEFMFIPSSTCARGIAVVSFLPLPCPALPCPVRMDVDMEGRWRPKFGRT